MGRYIRQTTKGNWNPDQLKNAVEAVKKGKKIRACAKKYKIPESTLRRRMKENNLDSPIMGVSTTFTPEQERIIVEYLKNVSGWFRGLNSIQCRKIAFDTAEKLKIKHKFNKKQKIAGKDWFCGFLKRNPDFSIRKPDVQSNEQFQQFYKKELNKFYHDLNLIIEKYEFSPDRIYNVQETEIYTVKVKENTGDKSLNSEVSWERANRTSVACATNAVGSFVPPMFVFPFEDKMQLMKISVPEDAVVECNSNGNVNEEMHLIWLKHFAEMVNPTRSDPVLLILNPHNGHASIDAYEFCKANHIHVLTLSPHAAFQMQPLNATIFVPLKRAYYRECEAYMRNTGTKEIPVYKIADLFTKALDKTASIDKAIKGFKSTGIWPVNPLVLDIKKLNRCTKINIHSNAASDGNDSAGQRSSNSNSCDTSRTSSSSAEDIDTSESSDSSENSDQDSDLCENRYQTRTRCQKKRKYNC
ncbi:uncharacterized protein LOC100680043 isoform X1 [Nasonia vitripennis]|uniref:Ig-like domain-containing protein n=1 Tax=Nasonia vitripennis TaxID=7425 RepID=A0A7M7LS38_NASVI|nr:uncharacterized protein LOC100680043 isoform X1 [Nasonia vitripennis]